MKSLLLFLLLATAGFAQRHERPDAHADRRPPRVILFEHADYEGDFIVLTPGDIFENLSGRTFPHGARLNDGVSSIRIEGGAELVVFSDARFRGAAMRVTDNIRDLTGRLLPEGRHESWNDQISSLRVEEVRHRTDGRDNRDKEIEAFIRAAYLDVLGRAVDPEGLRNYRRLVLEQEWSELMVREELRRSDEYRREGVERIIRRAYLDLLGREADARGLAQYRRNLLERGWNEGDMCDDLRRSEEYRRRSNRR
jgi:hypothetical protein